jgi:hypothetical protein
MPLIARMCSGYLGRNDTAQTDVTVVVLRGLDVVDLCVDCEGTRGHRLIRLRASLGLGRRTAPAPCVSVRKDDPFGRFHVPKWGYWSMSRHDDGRWELNGTGCRSSRRSP